MTNTGVCCHHKKLPRRGWWFGERVKLGQLRVWFQENATEDTIVAAELSKLLREEG